MQTDNSLLMLKKWYCEERAKLEESPIFKIESEIKFKRLRKDLKQDLEEELHTGKLKNAYKDFSNQNYFEFPQSMNLDNALSDIAIVKRTTEKIETEIPKEEYLGNLAEYFYQIELVKLIEKELIGKDKNIDLEQVYKEESKV